jgi:hypothetical protein
LRHLKVSEFLEKTLMSIKKLWKKLKKHFQKFRKFGSTIFDAKSMFFFKKQTFPWKFARGRNIERARS